MEIVPTARGQIDWCITVVYATNWLSRLIVGSQVMNRAARAAISLDASYSYGPLCYKTSPDRNNSHVTADVEPMLMEGIQRLLAELERISAQHMHT